MQAGLLASKLYVLQATVPEIGIAGVKEVILMEKVIDGVMTNKATEELVKRFGDTSSSEAVSSEVIEDMKGIIGDENSIVNEMGEDVEVTGKSKEAAEIDLSQIDEIIEDDGPVDLEETSQKFMQHEEDKEVESITTKPESSSEINEVSNEHLGYKEKRDEHAESLRNQFIDHVASEEYLDKLTLEFDGDIEKAEEEQDNRIDQMNSVEIDVNSDPETWSQELRDQGVEGYYDTAEHKIFVSKAHPNSLLSERTIHELAHSSTRGPFLVTENAKEKLTEAFESPNDSEFDSEYGEKTSYGLADEYLSEPTEMLARKQQLDLEMESLGIKKYGEKFTQEHYKKVMDMYKEGAFTGDANIFIETIKKDPKTFEKIFNEIAKNEDDSAKSQNIV